MALLTFILHTANNKRSVKAVANLSEKRENMMIIAMGSLGAVY